MIVYGIDPASRRDRSDRQRPAARRPRHPRPHRRQWHRQAQDRRRCSRCNHPRLGAVPSASTVSSPSSSASPPCPSKVSPASSRSAIPPASVRPSCWPSASVSTSSLPVRGRSPVASLRRSRPARQERRSTSHRMPASGPASSITTALRPSCWPGTDGAGRRESEHPCGSSGPPGGNCAGAQNRRIFLASEPLKVSLRNAKFH